MTPIETRKVRDKPTHGEGCATGDMQTRPTGVIEDAAVTVFQFIERLSYNDLKRHSVSVESQSRPNLIEKSNAGVVLQRS